MKNLKKHAGHDFTQFELSKIVLNNLKHFKLTPVGKLVLLVLVDCYNADNGNVVFPSIEFIADKIGCGLTATKQAINDLINEGLVIKSKRSKINGNYNKYLLTPKVQNPTSEQPQNELFKQSDNVRFMNRTKKIEQKKNTNFFNRKIDDIQAKQNADNYAKNQIARTGEMVKTYSTMVSEPPTENFKALKKLLSR